MTLNDSDYILFNNYVILTNPVTIKNINRLKRTGPVVFYSMTIAMFILNHDVGLFLFEMVLMTILSIFWVLISKKYFFYSTEKNIKKLIKDGRPPYNNEECLIKFEDENIHEISKSIDTKTSYSIVEKVVETENGIYIFNSSLSGYILPTRVFSDNQEKQKLIEFINSKIDDENKQN